MKLLKDFLTFLFLFVFMLFFANMAGVALDKEEKARHDMIENHKDYLSQNQTKHNDY